MIESASPWMTSSGNPVMFALSLFSNYRFSSAHHLQTYTWPLLVIHGDADSIIPFRNGQQVFERAASRDKVFVALSGADHNDPHGSHPGYWPGVERFLGTVPNPSLPKN